MDHWKLSTLTELMLLKRLQRMPQKTFFCHNQTVEYVSFIKHLPLLLALGIGEWLFHTIIRAITTPHVCLCVSVCSKCVFVFCCGGGVAGWTNMSFWVSGCRANIDQRAWRHAGQIKHSSDGRRAQRANDMPYHLDELASFCQTEPQHTKQEQGSKTRGWGRAAHTQHSMLQLYSMYIWICR